MLSSVGFKVEVTFKHRTDSNLSASSFRAPEQNIHFGISVELKDTFTNFPCLREYYCIYKKAL